MLLILTPETADDIKRNMSTEDQVSVDDRLTLKCVVQDLKNDIVNGNKENAHDNIVINSLENLRQESSKENEDERTPTPSKENSNGIQQEVQADTSKQNCALNSDTMTHELQNEEEYKATDVNKSYEVDKKVSKDGDNPSCLEKVILDEENIIQLKNEDKRTLTPSEENSNGIQQEVQADTSKQNCALSSDTIIHELQNKEEYKATDFNNSYEVDQKVSEYGDNPSCLEKVILEEENVIQLNNTTNDDTLDDNYIMEIEQNTFKNEENSPINDKFNDHTFSTTDDMASLEEDHSLPTGTLKSSEALASKDILVNNDNNVDHTDVSKKIIENALSTNEDITQRNECETIEEINKSENFLPKDSEPTTETTCKTDEHLRNVEHLHDKITSNCLIECIDDPDLTPAVSENTKADNDCLSNQILVCKNVTEESQIAANIANKKENNAECSAMDWEDVTGVDEIKNITSTITDLIDNNMEIRGTKEIGSDEVKNININKVEQIDVREAKEKIAIATKEMKVEEGEKMEIDEVEELYTDEVKEEDTDEVKEIDADKGIGVEEVKEIKKVDRDVMKELDMDKVKKIHSDEEIDEDDKKEIDQDEVKQNNTDKEMDYTEVKEITDQEIDEDEVKEIHADEAKQKDVDKIREIDEVKTVVTNDESRRIIPEEIKEIDTDGIKEIGEDEATAVDSNEKKKLVKESEGLLKQKYISIEEKQVLRKDKVPTLYKLSNTLNILSDDDDDDISKETINIATESNEKQCINIEDDDDIMLIDEDTNSNKECAGKIETDNNIPITLSSTKNNIIDSTESDNAVEPIKTTLIDEKVSTTPENTITDVIKPQISENEIKLQNEKIEDEKPLVSINFLNSFQKNLADMTRDDLEEFCMFKIVESIVNRSNLNEIKAKLKSMAHNIEWYKKKAMMLTKQNRDLQVVLKSVQEEQKKMGKAPITPLKITRSVGMQVLMTDKTCQKKKSIIGLHGSTNVSSSNNNARPTRNPVNQNTRLQKLNNNQIPVPRLVPAPNNTATKPVTQGNANSPAKTSSPVSNGTRNSPSTQKVADKRPYNKTQSNNVTVDLTDDEPPTKVTPRSTTMAVRLVPPQNLMATQRQFNQPINSPRKVYIPISGPQGQNIRPGQTVLLKTMSPAPRQRAPTPQIVRMPQNVRMTRSPSGRHPAPLPDAMKQYQPPNWKALPPAPDLKLSKVENGIVISWKIEGYQEDSYEEIASYQLYAYQETAQPPNTNLWKKIGDVKALPLPMACTLTQFMAGYKYYFAVRAVDVRSRLGPFSLPGSILLLNKM